MEWNREKFVERCEIILEKHCGGRVKTFNERVGKRDALTIWRHKENSVLTAPAAIAVMNAFGVSFNWLMGEDDDKPALKLTDDQRRLLGLFKKLDSEQQADLIGFATDLLLDKLE